jgi:2-methylfumaryl-CoA isomerase
MTGAKGTDSVPVNHVLPAWDLLAGSTAAVSILAAIAYRERTGHGQQIRVPLSDVAAATLATLGHIAEVSISGADRGKIGNSLFGAYGRDFACSDGKRVMVVALTAKQWKSLVDALAVHEQVTRLEAEVGAFFENDEGSRYIHRERIDDIIERAVERHTREALTERFRAAGVCFGPYRTVGEALAEDPSFVRANPIFSELEQPSGYTYPTPGFPASYSAVEHNHPVAAPRFGQHTEEVLASVLSMSATAIADLHDRGIVRL